MVGHKDSRLYQSLQSLNVYTALSLAIQNWTIITVLQAILLTPDILDDRKEN